MNESWEYKTIDFSETGFMSGKLKVEQLEARLNEMGRAGWELVTSVASGHGANKGVVLMLKRRR